MTPRELLALKPERTSHDIAEALPHVAESDSWYIEPETDERIETRYVKHVNLDGTRGWMLGSVWFDGRPALIFQEAGRKRSDHYKIFVVAPDVYWDLVKYSYSLPRTNNARHYEDAVEMDKTAEDLDMFYGCTLERMQKDYPSRRTVDGAES